jgi:hypothetical protein
MTAILDVGALVAIDDTSSRRIGELLAVSGTADLVDAHVALLSTPGDRILTSDRGDRGDLDALLRLRQVPTSLVEV